MLRSIEHLIEQEAKALRELRDLDDEPPESGSQDQGPALRGRFTLMLLPAWPASRLVRGA
jgi:hypothetical protein